MSDLGPEISPQNPSPNGSAAPKGTKTNNAGLFKKGHKGGPGNPLGKHSELLRTAFHNQFTKEDMLIIAEQIKQKCLKGNFEWTKFAFDYLMQNPRTDTQITNITLTAEEIDARIAEVFGTSDPIEPLKDAEKII